MRLYAIAQNAESVDVKYKKTIIFIVDFSFLDILNISYE